MDGDFYQDGQIVLHVTAKVGEVEQAGEKVILRGDVVTKETRNQLTLIGQEVEWQPKADLLIIRDKVQANQPKFQVNAHYGIVYLEMIIECFVYHLITFETQC